MSNSNDSERYDTSMEQDAGSDDDTVRTDGGDETEYRARAWKDGALVEEIVRTRREDAENDIKALVVGRPDRIEIDEVVGDV